MCVFKANQQSHPGDERVVFELGAQSAGRAMTWEDDAVWRHLLESLMNVREGNAIGIGGCAAANGSGE